MSDDRFKDDNTFKKPEKETSKWGLTLEDAIIQSIRIGADLSNLKPLIDLLPEDKKAKLREIYIAERMKLDGEKS